MLRRALLLATTTLAACGGEPKPAADTGAAPQPTPAAAAAPTPAEPNLTPISACSVFTAEDVQAVYAGKTFAVESKRDDPPNPYNTLSACRYSEGGSADPLVYHVELTVRVLPKPAEAMKKLTDAKAMDVDKTFSDVSGIGDAAVFYNRSMASNGPVLEFVSGSAYYQLNLQTLASNAGKTAEAELKTLAGKVLAP